MIRFQRNDSVLADFPKKFCEHEYFLHHKIFMAGEMSLMGGKKGK